METPLENLTQKEIRDRIHEINQSLERNDGFKARLEWGTLTEDELSQKRALKKLESLLEDEQ